MNEKTPVIISNNLFISLLLFLSYYLLHFSLSFLDISLHLIDNELKIITNYKQKLVIETQTQYIYIHTNASSRR